MAAAETATALIAAGGVALGATLTGGWALANQWITRRAEERRALREADERERTRFHETRREAYASFLGAVSDASGYMLNLAIRHQKAAGHDPGRYGVLRHPAEDDQSFSDSPREMTRHQSIILMISGSPDVRRAVEDLVTAVTIVGMQSPNVDGEAWNRELEAATEQQRRAYRQFVDAANAELTGQSSVKSVAVPTEGSTRR